MQGGVGSLGVHRELRELGRGDEEQVALDSHRDSAWVCRESAAHHIVRLSADPRALCRHLDLCQEELH